MSGTDLAYGGRGLRAYYSLSGTDLAYGATTVPATAAMEDDEGVVVGYADPGIMIPLPDFCAMSRSGLAYRAHTSLRVA
eukprot:2003312-Rhodomonas_salina.3